MENGLEYHPNHPVRVATNPLTCFLPSAEGVLAFLRMKLSGRVSLSLSVVMTISAAANKLLRQREGTMW